MKAVVLSVLASLASAMELTAANWDSSVAGKTVFIKFLAPWCGHCEAMKPDWDSLMNDFKNSTTGLVADVDCTAEENLCKKHQVAGFPMDIPLLWGDPSDLKPYEGDHDLKSLQDFASENLGPQCTVDHLENCDKTDKKFIQKFLKWDIDELESGIEEKDQQMARFRSLATNVVDGLEKQIGDKKSRIADETTKKDKAIADLKKSSGLKFMLAVNNLKFPPADPDHDPEFDDAKDAAKEGEKEEF